MGSTSFIRLYPKIAIHFLPIYPIIAVHFSSTPPIIAIEKNDRFRKNRFYLFLVYKRPSIHSISSIRIEAPSISGRGVAWYSGRQDKLAKISRIAKLIVPVNPAVLCLMEIVNH